MGSIGQAIYALDKRIFYGIRAGFGTEFLDSILVYLGNLYFWTPLIVFLMVLLVNATARGSAMNVLYGLAAIVLAYQSGFLLSYFFGQPAPYVVEHLAYNVQLPGFQNVYAFSFPDWATAALTALIVFTRFRVRSAGGYFPRFMMLAVVVLGFCRVHAGNAYPYDVLGGYMLGQGVALILRLFARNLDLILYPGDGTGTQLGAMVPSTPTPSEDTISGSVDGSPTGPEAESSKEDSLDDR
jgi:membrane-associated phospholipid phosphatase